MNIKNRHENSSNIFILPAEEFPRHWYNILPDLPAPFPPPKDPEDGYSRLEILPKIFSGGVLGQEVAKERYIEIPDEVRALYLQAGRPRPLFRAKRLEDALDTPAKLYYKSEFYSPTGSHKVNTAIAQAYYAKAGGASRMTTETGAGQWGTALAYACSLVGLDLTVYWVKNVASWKLDRKNFMELYGAEVYDSPSENTSFGREVLDRAPDHPGSLGIAISEAIEDARDDDNAVYSLGSVLNHVLLHQTVIGLETQKQMEMAGDYPDIVISCLGGGSNFGGLAIPFIKDHLAGDQKVEFLASQSDSAPNLQGEYRYDFGDYAEQTPMLKMCTLGHQADLNPPIKGDGLRYHATAPIISLLRNHGLIDTKTYPSDEKYVFEMGRLFLKHEGFLPASESNYSIAAAIDEANKCKATGEAKTILFNISGHGFMDMGAYRQILNLQY